MNISRHAGFFWDNTFFVPVFLRQSVFMRGLCQVFCGRVFSCTGFIRFLEPVLVNTALAGCASHGPCGASRCWRPVRGGARTRAVDPVDRQAPRSNSWPLEPPVSLPAPACSSTATDPAPRHRPEHCRLTKACRPRCRSRSYTSARICQD